MIYAAGPIMVLPFFFVTGPASGRHDFAQVVLISTDINFIRIIIGQAILRPTIMLPGTERVIYNLKRLRST
jgi:hypothetical protein